MSVMIMSAGQPGTARVALDSAIELGLLHGGWCPKAEQEHDLSPETYHVTQTPGFDDAIECNVRDSDATVVFSIEDKLAGSALETLKCAQKLEKPWIYLPAVRNEDAPRRLWQFMVDTGALTLNVAGPTASEDPRAAEYTSAVLHRLFKPAVIWVVHHVATFLRVELEQVIQPSCRVETFSNPEHALHRFSTTSSKPDLLITGFLFQPMRGTQLIEELKRLKPDVKTLLFAFTPRKAMGNLPVEPDAHISLFNLGASEALCPVTQELLRFRWPVE